MEMSQVVKLLYAYSSPLVYKDSSTNSLKSSIKIDCSHDEELILRVLKQSKKSIRFQSIVATAEQLTTKSFIQTPSPALIHFTCHGTGRDANASIIMEGLDGIATILKCDDLSTILKTSKTGQSTKLAVIAACYSEATGLVFVREGIPHVVAVNHSDRLSNAAARLFTETFYSLLLQNKTVLESFQNAVLRAKLESNGVMGNEFVLLPQGGNHNVVLFENLQDGTFINETQKLCIVFSGERSDNVYIDRNIDMHRVFSAFSDQTTKKLSCQTVVIRGEPGMGKTTLALRTIDYMATRGVFDIILHLPIDRYLALNQIEPNQLQYAQLFEAILQVISPVYDRNLASVTVDEFIAALRSASTLRRMGVEIPTTPRLSEEINEEPRILFFFDGADSIIQKPRKLSSSKNLDTGEKDREGPSLLVDFIDKAERSNKSVCFLLGLRPGTELCPQGSGYLRRFQERDVSLTPLNSNETVSLLSQVMCRRLTDIERTDLTTPFSSNRGSCKVEDLLGETRGNHAIITALHGNPRAIMYFAQYYANHKEIDDSDRCLDAAKEAYLRAVDYDWQLWSDDGNLPEAIAISSTISLAEASATVPPTQQLANNCSSYPASPEPGPAPQGTPNQHWDIAAATATNITSLSVEAARSGSSEENFHLSNITGDNEGRQSLISSARQQLNSARISMSLGSIGSSPNDFDCRGSIIHPTRNDSEVQSLVGYEDAFNRAREILTSHDENYLDLWARLTLNTTPPHKPWECVSWGSLVNELCLIVAELTTGPENGPERLLTRSDVNFLMSKIGCSDSDQSVDPVSYDSFLKWWIPVSQTLQLLRREFRHSTMLVHGFLSRAQAVAMLMRVGQPGTYLLRFSDSRPGHLSLSVLLGPSQVQHWLVVVNPGNGQVSLEDAMESFATLRDLLMCPRYAKLKAVYPGIATAEAFNHHL